MILAKASIQGVVGQSTEFTHSDAVTNGPVSVTLNGAGVDSEGGSIDAFQWVILEKPSGSAATLSAATSAQTLLQGIDKVGTYRVMLIAKITASSLSSTTNLLNAPSTAFVEVVVRTKNLSLYKPAKGQRNWHDEYHHLVDEVDKLYDTIQTITSGESNTKILTSVVSGSRIKSAAKEGASNAMGWAPGVIAPAAAEPGSNACAAFYVQEAGVIRGWSATVAGTGDTSDASSPTLSGTILQLRIFDGDGLTEFKEGSANITTGGTTYTEGGDIQQSSSVGTLTIPASQPTAHLPGGAKQVLSKTYAANSIIVVFVTQVPDRGAVKAPLTIQIHAHMT